MYDDAADAVPLSMTRQFRLDRSHSRVARAEDSLKQLRQRIERQQDQEVRLGELYQGWQQHWSTQCDQMQQQVARLESLLAAWMPQEHEPPVLSVIDHE